jgi:hypothetical protein
MTTRSNLNYSVDAESIQRSLRDALSQSASASLATPGPTPATSTTTTTAYCIYYTCFNSPSNAFGAKVHQSSEMFQASISKMLPWISKLSD